MQRLLLLFNSSTPKRPGFRTVERNHNRGITTYEGEAILNRCIEGQAGPGVDKINIFHHFAIENDHFLDHVPLLEIGQDAVLVHGVRLQN